MGYLSDEGAMQQPTAQRNASGGIELVWWSDRGRTIYFDSAKDALRRWNAWVMMPRTAPQDPHGIIAELIESHVAEDEDLVSIEDEVEPQRAVPVLCIAEPIQIDYSGEERRSETRVRPHDVCWLMGVRILYAARVPVVDLCSDGVLIETGRELPMGTTIPIELFGKKGALAVAGEVLRSRRFVQGDVVWYETACRFKRPVDLTGLVPRFLQEGERVRLTAYALPEVFTSRMPMTGDVI